MTLLPVAPLLPFLRQMSMECGSDKNLARLLEARGLGTQQVIARQLVWWFGGQRTKLSERSADRWATAINLHPSLVWGEEWWGDRARLTG